MVRLDHFRGFAGYWEVPGEDETAAGGRWRTGPGLDLFDAVRDAVERLVAYKSISAPVCTTSAAALTNARIAAILTEIADLLDIKGESSFKVGAYRRAAATLVELDQEVETILELQGTKGLEALPGIGKGLAADLVTAELCSAGATGALVGIGGDLVARGTPPDDAGWVIVVEDPDDPAVALARIAIDAGGVATSSTRSNRWLVDRPSLVKRVG